MALYVYKTRKASAVELYEKQRWTAMTTDGNGGDKIDFPHRPKRCRVENGKHRDTRGNRLGSLELGGVISVLKEYDDYDGGVNCSICGKLYKSKVCFIKHIWEHSVYWEVFTDCKNHERVLAIQAALILYSSCQGVAMDENNVLTHLLVTSPGSHGICEKKPLQHVESDKQQITYEQRILAEHRNQIQLAFTETSPLKRKRGD